VKAVRDSDLMQLADRELDASTAAELEAALGPEQRAKMAAIADLGQAVRGHLELAADEAEPRLARMWDEIDKRIGLDHRAAAATPTPARQPVPADDAAPTRGWWGRLGHWLDDHRSHVWTGVLSAGAVAAVALVLGPRTTIIERTATGPAIVPAVYAGAPPSVESLDVTGGSGTVFTIEDEDGATAVIWVTPPSPDDTVEGL
jgi:hypothetical protein